MASLSIEEIASLHLFHYLDTPTNVEIFERLYNPDFKMSGYYRRTFTQRYQPVYKQVRATLADHDVALWQFPRVYG